MEVVVRYSIAMTVDASRWRAFFIRRMNTRMFWLSARHPDLLLEEVGRPEEELALDVDDRDLRGGAAAPGRQLGQVAALVDGVFDQGRGAGLPQEKGERDPDADVDGRVERRKRHEPSVTTKTTRSDGVDRHAIRIWCQLIILNPMRIRWAASAATG
jgi:hypothetical protein